MYQTLLLLFSLTFTIDSIANEVLSMIQKESSEHKELTRTVVNKNLITSNVWRNVTTNTADSLKWQPYGKNIIEDVDDFIKITIQNDDRGALLRLKNIARSLISPPDKKNYRITFTAYIVKGSAKSSVVVKNMATWHDATKSLTENPLKYVIKLPNTNQDRPFIQFLGAPTGSSIYISKQIRIEQMRDRVYKQPSIPFKGVILDMKEPRSKAVIEEWFRDLDKVGAKFIRLQVSPTFSMEGLTTSQYMSSIVDRVKTKYLPLIRQYGMKAMVCYEGMPFDDPALKNRKNVGYWKNPITKQTFRAMAHSLANGLKNESEILAFQFCAEPIDSNNKTPENWYEISEEVIEIVRQYTDKFIVWSNGPGGLSRYNKVVPFDDDKIIYNYHNYAPAKYTHQGTSSNFKYGIPYPGSKIMVREINSIVAFRDRNNNIPIMCGAYSVVNWASDGDLWLSDFITLLEKNNVPAVQHLFGQYRPWDWRYIGIYHNNKANSFIYDTSRKNKLWTLLSNYLKDSPK